ncbi:hypothetical protein GH714_028140 [Hevea brasiliensis]|uniref:CCT domain-containing protein n=1 Tax=Hevea brasiliensis TaxID=3981 RepID=A0A6A6MFR8_HEVBR|nr:hypothetical protein GH714_028140 [Hevea brasiliensis]
MQNFSQDIQQLEEYCNYKKTNALLSNIFQTSTISEYDLGGEGDLFKAPEPIIEEPLVGLDPMTAALSMISCGEEVISSQGLKVADIESIETEQLLSEIFYECKKDLMEKAAIETPLSEILDIKIPVMRVDENQTGAGSLIMGFYDRLLVMGTWDSSILPLISHSLSAAAPLKTAGKSFPGTGIRRQRGTLAGKLRKALADSQPRIRGRFAKTEDSDVSKRQ